MVKRQLRPIYACLVLLSVLSFFGCYSANTHTFDQQSLDALAASLYVEYQVTNNQGTDVCPTVGLSECFTATLSLTFADDTPSQGWSLYFSHLTPIKGVTTNLGSIDHINGDLHRLMLNRDIVAGERIDIPFIAQFWHVNRSDIVPNMYVAADNLSARIVSSTKAIQDPNTGINIAPHAGVLSGELMHLRGNDDELPKATSEWLYDYYSSFPQATDDAPRIIPDVKSAQWSDDSVALPAGLNVRSITNAGVDAGLNILASQGAVFNDEGLPVKWTQVDAEPEAYYIDINDSGISLKSKDTVGLNYALLSLAQVFDLNHGRLPIGTIEDNPSFVYRGMHIDIARNFQGKKAVFQLVEEMFVGKLNRLHLHFADDEGWRIAIQEFPELTQLGAFRCVNGSDCMLPQLGSGTERSSAVNGYLTENDYIELLQYAAARNIEIIPSFDTPGHARAAVKAMESRYSTTGDSTYRLLDPDDRTEYSSIQYYNDNTLNPCIESSYAFVDTVVGRLQAIHAAAGTPLKTFHLGADETAGAWIESPACEAQLGRSLDKEDVHHLLGVFVQRVYALTKQRGLSLAGWSDGMGTIPTEQRSENMLVTVWTTLAAGGDSVAHDWNESPAKSVYSFPDALYFDFPYQNHPDEPGYYWASKNTDLFKVFQFTPHVLPVHQWLWTDPKGRKYKASNSLASASPFGIQGQVWTEVIRSPETLEYMLYPRLYALGERAWNAAPWQQDAENVVLNSGANTEALLEQQKRHFKAFLNQLSRYHLPRLAQNGVNFRIPAPGLKYKDNKIHSITLYPGEIIEVHHDGQWQRLTDDYPASPSSQFRSRFPGAQQASRAVCLTHCSSDR